MSDMKYEIRPIRDGFAIAQTRPPLEGTGLASVPLTQYVKDSRGRVRRFKTEAEAQQVVDKL